MPLEYKDSVCPACLLSRVHHSIITRNSEQCLSILEYEFACSTLVFYDFFPPRAPFLVFVLAVSSPPKCDCCGSGMAPSFHPSTQSLCIIPAWFIFKATRSV